MKKVIIIFTFINLIFLSLYSQQALPVEMINKPTENKFSISGVGGGNINELKMTNTNASAQLAIDFNIKLSENNNINTLSTMIKYNPVAKTTFSLNEKFEMSRIAFIDNQYMFFLGIRNYSLKEINEAGWFNSFFADFSVSPYNIVSTIETNNGFYNFNTTSGFQFGYTTATGFGVIALTFALQANYFYIYDYTSSDWAFDELLNYTEKTLSRQWFGGGGKIIFQINDFAIYIESRYYAPIENQIQIRDFSTRPIFSIGGIATGTIFKNKN